MPHAEPVRPPRLEDPQEQRRRSGRCARPPRRRDWIHGKSPTCRRRERIAYRMRGTLTTLKKPCWYWASWSRPGIRA